MEYSKVSIREWPVDERPREKLLKSGEHTLSDSELLAILLRTGIKGESALDLARRIMGKFKTFRAMCQADPSAWKGFKGLGPAKVCQIKAALEIGRRFRENDDLAGRAKIKSSSDAAKLMMPRMRDLTKEVFKVLCLDSRNQVREIIEVTQGTVNQACPIIREVFQKALEHFAASIICCHNHPSGDPAPSPEDREFTRQLVAAGQALGVNVLDHIIVGDNVYYSFCDKGDSAFLRKLVEKAG